MNEAQMTMEFDRATTPARVVGRAGGRPPHARVSTRAANLWPEIERTRRMYRRNPRGNYGPYRDAWARLKEHGEAVRQQLAALGIETRVDHAYTPNERGNYGGAEHIVVLDDLDSGRLHRKAGDALCKPADQFWGLEHTHGGPASCKTCIERAEQIVDRAC